MARMLIGLPLLLLSVWVECQALSPDCVDNSRARSCLNWIALLLFALGLVLVTTT